MIATTSSEFPIFMRVVFALGTLGCLAWFIQSSRNRFRAVRLADVPERTNSLHPLLILAAYILPYILATVVMVTCWGTATLRDSILLLVLFSVLAQACQIGAFLLLARNTFAGGLAEGYGLRCGKRASDVLRGGFAWLCVMPMCYALVVGMGLLMLHFEIEIPVHSAISMLGDLSPLGKGVLAVSLILLAPLAEELFYRGIVQTYLRKWVSPWGAIGITSLIFPMMHGGLYNTWPSLLFLSLVLGYCYERTGRLTSSILIHALFNATTVVNLLVFQSA